MLLALQFQELLFMQFQEQMQLLMMHTLHQQLFHQQLVLFHST